MAAFGAWHGGAQQGNYGGLPGMFEGLSQGLSELGKTFIAKESDERKEKLHTAQDAANKAFEMNLARFNRNAAREQSEAVQRHEDLRADKRDATENAHFAATQAHQERQDAQTARFQGAELGLRAQSEKNAEHRADQADRRTTELEGRQDRIDQRQMTREEKEKLEKVDAATDKDLERFDKADKDTQVAMLKSVGAKPAMTPGTFYGENIGSDADSLAKNRAAYEQAVAQKHATNLGVKLPSASAADTASKGPPPLPADRQAVMDAYVKQGSSPADAYKHAKDLPQDTINKVVKPAGAPQASTQGAPDDFMAPDGGAPPAQAVAAAPTAPAPAQGAPAIDPNSGAPVMPDAGAQAPQVADASAPADATAPPDATAAPEQAPDPTAQYAQMSQQLQQSPEGQGALTTLDRLASAPDGPIADKMRRAAQNSLTSQFPDADSNGFIDYYLQQQQQEPQADTEMA